MASQASQIDRIENVLAAHALDLDGVARDRSVKAGYTMACACGFRYEPDPDVDHHRRHVASALAERMSSAPSQTGASDD